MRLTSNYTTEFIIALLPRQFTDNQFCELVKQLPVLLPPRHSHRAICYLGGCFGWSQRGQSTLPCIALLMKPVEECPECSDVGLDAD
jgi:hypothetical protein